MATHEKVTSVDTARQLILRTLKSAGPLRYNSLKERMSAIENITFQIALFELHESKLIQTHHGPGTRDLDPILALASGFSIQRFWLALYNAKEFFAGLWQLRHF